MPVKLLFHRLAARRFARRPVACCLPKPIVSFTFDDFPRSALTCAGRILSGAGLKATYYVSLGLMDGATVAGEMFHADDLRQLAASGHELACHTFEHAGCQGLSPPEILRTCERNSEHLSKILPGYKLENFSYPAGLVSFGAKAALRSRFRSCRGIEPGINRGIVDLAFLRAYALYGSADSVNEAIARNAAQRGWVIVYTHDVTAKPSPYGCTPDSFRRVLELALDSGADVLPVREALERVCPTT